MILRFLNVTLTVALAMLVVIFAFVLGPAFETEYFPAYSKFRLLSVQQTEKGVIATFEFTKYRNCDPQGYAWYNGDMGAGFMQLNSRNRGQTIVPRPLGTQTTTPMEIEGITPVDLATSVFAEIYSHCHPFWITKSKIYP